MKLIKTDWKQDVVVKAELPEDLWALKKIVAEGDIAGAKTFRSVDVKGSTEKTDKRPMFLKVKVEKIQFDDNSLQLKLIGKIVEGPENVPHDYHTLAIGLNSELNLHKEKWQESEKIQLKEATKYKGLKALLVVCDEREADIARATELGVKHLATIRSKKTGKAFADKSDEQMTKDYYESIISFLGENISGTDAIIIAGPGFAKDNLYNRISEPALKKMCRTTDCSVTGKTGINEVIKRGALQEILLDSRLSEETKLIEDFLALISKDSKKAIYGYIDVKKAVESGAVELLMISDKHIRKEEIEELLGKAESTGAEIKIISSDHDAGEQLVNLTGIAAFLRFAI